MNNFPWWILFAPAVHPTVKIVFILIAGIIQGRKTGYWPTLSEWASAASTMQSPANSKEAGHKKWLGHTQVADRGAVSGDGHEPTGAK